VISRVWKRTLYKLAKGFGVVVGFIAYAGTGMYIGSYFFGSKEGGLFGFYAAGFLAFIIRWAYQDAQHEIELENERLMREIRLGEIQKKVDQI